MSGAEAVISAFSEDHVERLTGLSKGRLRYWDRIGFFTPEHASETRRSPYSRVYSFRDVVGLRTLELLRNDHKVSLQHLREVARKLDHLKDALWTRTTLYVLKRRVYVVLGKGKPPIDPTTGQYAIEAVALEAVMASVSEAAKELRTRPAAQHGRITRHRYIAHNAPVIAGTRITTQAIKNFRDSGYSVEQIIREYPDLTAADVSAALAHKEAPAPALN
jgi:uncharacterized protein (DUF433 family)